MRSKQADSVVSGLVANNVFSHMQMNGARGRQEVQSGMNQSANFSQHLKARM